MGPEDLDKMSYRTRAQFCNLDFGEKKFGEEVNQAPRQLLAWLRPLRKQLEVLSRNISVLNETRKREEKIKMIFGRVSMFGYTIKS